MADNVSITPGTGDVVAADQVSDGTLGTCKVQYVKIMDGTIDGTAKATVGTNGLKVDGSSVTQPISAASLPLPTGASTEATLASLNGKVTAVNTGAVTISAALPAGTNVIGHVIADSGSTTTVTGNVAVVQPTGTNLHTVVDSGTVTLSGTSTISGTVVVSNFPATQPVNGTITANAGTGTFAVSAVSLPLPVGASTSALQTTGNTSLGSIDGKTPALGQALAAASTPVVLTAAQITALTPLTSVTVTQATGTNLHVVVDSAPTIAVTGTFFQATQPISAASLPLPTGAATEATLSSLNSKVTAVNTNAVTISTALPAGTNVIGHVIADSGTITAVTAITNALPAGTNVIGHVIADSGSTTAVTGNVTVVQPTGTNLHAVLDSGTTTVTQATGTNLHVVVDSAPTTPVTGTFFQATQPVSGTVAISSPVQVQSSTLVVTATAATGVAVTATLPAVAAQFHYISFIEVVKYFTVANAASATPLVVTTTNIPGSLAFTFGQPLGTIGTTDRMIHAPNSPIHSTTVNTATTVVCPATVGIIWRVNVYYFAAV